jgi:glycosyltransferase domain-containing protein
VAAPRYSLVIPTYNRPEDLGRLLRFLAFQKAAFPVLVLDSSRPENAERNRAAAAGLELDVRLESFPESMPPWEKFKAGADMVRTEYASLCADDDLLLVASLAPILDHLARNPDCGVAHGRYFQFYLSGAFGLMKMAYRSPSIDAAQPIDRLRQLFANYEALTYGVHRTALLQEIMARVQGLQTMLGRELLGGALAVVRGKAVRLPVMYAGRSLGPSAPYADWHPLNFLLDAPQGLFDEYQRYRRILLDAWKEGAAQADLVDLVHLRYLSDYYRPAVIDYVEQELRQGRTKPEIMGGIWPVLLEHRGIEGALHRSRWLRRMRDRFAPWLRGYHVRKFTRALQYRTVSSGTRDYHVYREFEGALAEGGLATRPEDLVELLAGYA